MDSNGTRFHMLLGKDDWGACLIDRSTRLADDWAGAPSDEVLRTRGWDSRRSELTLPAQVFRFTAAPRDAAPRLSNRRGAGADRYGNWYWIDDREQSIMVKSVGSGAITPFWSTGDGVQCDTSGGDFEPCEPDQPPPLLLRGLAVTAEHYLVVGVVRPAGLLLFDLHAGDAPRQMVWPVSFAPFDMAPIPGGGVWILDRRLDGPGARLWALDRRLDVTRLSPLPQEPEQPADFSPLDGSSAPRIPGCDPAVPFGPDAAFDLTTVRDPVAVEALPDGTALLLDNGGDGQPGPPFSQIWRYTLGQGLSSPVSTRELSHSVEEQAQAHFSLLGHDLAFLPAAADEADESLGRALIVSQDGNQTYAFALAKEGSQLALKPLAEYWPMRLFGGRGLVAAGAQAYYDSRGDWIPLVEQPRPRYETELTILTPARRDVDDRASRPAFDGREPDCVWHRLLFDGCIPPDAEVQVWSRAANAEQDLPGAAWQPEPRLYRRGDGSELPFVRASALKNEGTWELLFQRTRGRFLQLKLTLRGNGRSTPRLRALRAYYPRFSYLDHYLPAVYRDDTQSAAFLDRFLANLEGMYTSIEDKIAAIQVLFDVRSVPPEYLEWLAGWFGVVFDPHWEEARQRLFLAHAPQLFSERGTLPGLIRAIRLATDACPDELIFDDLGTDDQRPQAIRIIERFRTRLAPGVVFGDPSQIEGPGLTTEVSDWTPAQGPEPLHARYRDYLRRQYATIAALNAAWGTAYTDFDAITLPPTRPAQPAIADDWERFLRAGLGFTYAPVDAADAQAYRDFLTNRYGNIAALSRAHERAYTSLDQVTPPAALPAAATPLRDWIQFVSVLVPTVQNAHRFTVLVPSEAGQAPDDRGEFVDRVRRIVDLEKPAHTSFEVKEYWAAFRVGEARLGFDSLLDRGSRLVAMMLNRSYLAEGYLSFSHPWNVAGRMPLGRDRVGDRRQL